jgi:hypothetical protein
MTSVLNSLDGCPVASLFAPENTTIISFRKVISDVCCGPWEPMPEIQPATLRELANYLMTCPGWHFKHLNTKGHSWDKQVISYGLQAQFYLPYVPKQEELDWIVEQAARYSELEIKDDYIINFF